MAEFVAPQFQNPDIIGSYLRGRMAPVALEQAQQENEMRGLQMDQLRMALGRQQMFQDYAQNLLTSPQSQPQANAGGTSGGIQNGPQSAVSQPPTQPTNQTGYGAPGGMDGRTLAALSILGGKDPTEALNSVQTLQKATTDNMLQQRKLQLSGPMDLAHTVATSSSADVLIKNNPALAQQWVQMAPQLGLDPYKDLTPENARKVAVLAYNNLASQTGQDPLSMPDVLQTKYGPNGSIYQVDPLNNKLTQIQGEESLHQVIDPKTGQPVLLPASQATGKVPFNQSIFGAANMSDQAIQFAADTYRTTGKFPVSVGRNPAMQAKILERVATDAAAQGDTAGSIAARSAALKANGMALDQVSRQQNLIGAFEKTAEKNLQLALQYSDKVDRSGSPLINKAIVAWKQGVTGDPDTASFVNALTTFKNEYAKVLSGGTGSQGITDSARHEADDLFSKIQSKETLQQVARVARQEMSNRMSAFDEQKALLQQGLSGNAPGAANIPLGRRAAPQAALDYLKQHPEAADQFRAKYGYLP